MIHINTIDGYQTFAHNPDAENVSNAIREIASRRSRVKILLNPIKQSIEEEADFEKRCTAYFEGNFETLATETPLILPYKEPKNFKEIVNTMEQWCRKTNKSSKLKGLVLHSFLVFKHLEHFGFTGKVLKDGLNIERFSEEPVIIVYNPQENVILLVRNAQNQDLTTDIRFGLDDLNMFILLFYDKLKYSNMKLISLIVTDKSQNFKCPNCKNNLLSLEDFKDIHTFENCWEERATYFEKEYMKNVNHGFIKTFLATMTGTVAATLVYGKYIPTLTDKSDEQMANVAVLLTQEQLEIVYSEYRHIIIRGGFGCGKTIIAVAMLRKISGNLESDEKLYYICYDPRSELLDQKVNVDQKEGFTNVIPFHNKDGCKLSEIINGILQKKENTRKINFVVDEYDGEDLDESEAKSLNEIFNESLKEMFVILIPQPIEKQRIINNIPLRRNRFELLKNMKIYGLNRVMRNSIEIHNLVKLTSDVLQKQQTVFNYQEDRKMKSETYGEYTYLSNTGSTLPSRASVPHTFSKVKSRLDQTKAGQGSMKRDHHVELLGVDQTKAVAGSMKKDYQADLLALDQPKAVAGSMRKDYHADLLGLDQTKVAADSMKKNQHVDHHEYPKNNPRIPKLGLDEAQALSGSNQKTINGGVKTISKFQFAAMDRIGHKIHSKKPTLFELGNKSDFQKILSLIAIFDVRQIKRGEQVILHFDTRADKIPSNFLFTFIYHFKIQSKVTKNYKEFKSGKNTTLVCSYPNFRGLEHPKITVVLDFEIYYVQHLLVEMLSRCTSDLCIIVLQNSPTLADVTREWKTKQLIEQWGIEIFKDASQREDFKLDCMNNNNPNIINATFKREYYENLEKKFTEIDTESKHFASKQQEREEAKKVIRKR